MPIIQRPDLVQRIRRAFGLQYPANINTVSPEIVPVVLVDDLTAPSIEEGFPREAVGYAICGASVGVFSEVYIINPTASLVDLVLDGFYSWISAGGTTVNVKCGLVSSLNNLLGTQAQRFNVDLRTAQTLGAVPRPVAGVDSRNQAAVLGNSLCTITVPGSQSVFFPFRFTLPPGTFIGLSPSSNNKGIEAMWFWTERQRL